LSALRDLGASARNRPPAATVLAYADARTACAAATRGHGRQV